MNHTKLAFLLTLTALSLCFSCEKEHLAGEFLLTDEMRVQNPYQGGETLKFISDSGDVYLWYVKGRSNQVHKTPVGINTTDYYLVEIDNTSISLENNTEYFSFQLEMGGQFGDPKYAISLIYEEKGSGFGFNLPLSTETTLFKDSLFIMNSWLKNVFICEKEIIDSRAYKLYYSTEYGIVKIDFSDGSGWELENIEW